MRSAVFAYGSLQIPEVLQTLLGRAFRARPARLDGYRRRVLAGKRYPAIAPHATDSVEGALLEDVDAASLARLDDFEGPPYRRIPVEVTTPDGGRQRAFAYALDSERAGQLTGEEWKLETFCGRDLAPFLALCTAVAEGWRAERGAMEDLLSAGASTAEDESPSRIRSFLAIELVALLRHELSDAIAALRTRMPRGAIRWVPPPNLHLTLHFLGDVEPAALRRSLPALQDALRRRAGFDLILDGIRLFPTSRRPRVVIAGVAGSEEITRLAGGLAPALAAAGLPIDPRPQRPHITLGRIARGRTVHSNDLHPSLSASLAGARMAVAEVTLYRSRLAAEGAQYTALARLPLGGAEVED